MVASAKKATKKEADHPIEQIWWPLHDRRESHNAHVEGRANITGENANSDNANHSARVNASQVVLHTLKRSITDRVRCEVDSVMSTVETRLDDAILIAMENLVILSEEIAMKPVNAFSGRNTESIVLVPDQRDFSGSIESLQMTISIRINSTANLIRIDEIRDNITIEVGDLSVKKTLTVKRALITIFYLVFLVFK